MIVSEGNLQYGLAENWAHTPEGWDHRDVSGIATDAEDRVYVFSRSAHPVTVYRRDGRFLDSWGEDLVGRAHGIAVIDDFVFLADLDHHTVFKCTSDGRLLMTLGTRDRPSDSGYVREAPANLTTIARGAGPFNRPTKARVAPNGEIYVADGYGNARIHRFTADGTLIQSWGEPGTEPGQFNCPHSLWIHTDGRVFVCDRENDRIQIFSGDGHLLDVWPDIPRVADIHIDDTDRVYLAEQVLEKGWLSPSGRVIDRDRPPKVSIRDIEGNVLATWGGPDVLAEGTFVSAHSICVDSHGDIYVGELTAATLSERYTPGMKTVQKFIRI
jgi:DNA-binding beta-propeller fold protein YncE